MKIYTEKEFFLQNEHFAFRLKMLYIKNPKLFFEMSDCLPFSVYINKQKNLDITYINNKLLSKGREVEELVAKGGNYLKEISCPKLLKKAIERTNRFKVENDTNAICTNMQQIKINNKMEYFYSNKLLLDDNLFFNVSNFLNEMGSIGKVLTSILEPIHRNEIYWQEFKSLTKQEKIIIKLLANGLTKKQISDKLFISTHTVHTHKKNIYTKLNINKISELVKFSLALEII